MKKEQLKQLIREAIIAERNSSIDVVKNIIKNKFGIDTEIDETGKFIVFPEHQNIPSKVIDAVIEFAPDTKIHNGIKSLTLKDGTIVNRRVIEFP